MKCFLPTIILVFTIGGYGQSVAEPRLIDEFGRISCDDFLARIDGLYHQLNTQPEAKGYFVIAGGKEFLREKLKFELLFESAVLQGRGRFDRKRVTLIRGENGGPLHIRLWIDLGTAKATDFGETKWDLRITDRKEPFLLRSDMAQICDPPPIDRVAKDLLEANPDGSIFVVVHGPTAGERQSELRIARKMLSPFESARVRYFLRRSGTRYSDYYFTIGNPSRTTFKSDF